MNIDELKNLSSKVSDLKRVLSEKVSKNSSNVSVNNVDIEGTLRVGILGDIVEILQLVTQESHGLMSKEDKKKLDGVAEGATNYVHPPTHPANIIVESTDKRFVSDVLIDKWNRKADEIVGNYVPETLGSDVNKWLRCDNTWQPITASNVGALPITGGRLLGELGMNPGNEIKWYGNTDRGTIGFKNDSDLDTDSFMYFETSDNGNEYFKFSHRYDGSNKKEDWFTIKSDGIRAKGEIFALNDKKVFHTGNFNPNSKINQGGDTVTGDYKFKGYTKFGSASDNNIVGNKVITEDIKNSAIEITAPQTTSHNQKTGVVFHHTGTATAALKYVSVNANKSYFDFVSDDSDPLEVKVAGSPVWTHKTFVKDNYYDKTSVDKIINDLISNMDWKESVERFEDLATTYPHPEDGWTVNVKENNYTYRWDGGKWIVISINNLSLVTGSVDGLMSRHDKTKLDGIETGANKYIHPSTHSADMITETPNKKFVSQEMINRWDAVSGDNTGLHLPELLPSSDNKWLRCDGTWKSITPDIVNTYSKGELNSMLSNKENIGMMRPNVVALSHSTEPGTETNYFIIKTNTNYGDPVMPHMIIRGKGLLEVGYTIPITIKIGFYYFNNNIYIPRAIVDSPTVINTSNKPIYICNIDGKYAIAIPGGYCAHISVDLINSSGKYSITPSGWSIFNKTKTEVEAISVKTVCPVAISYNSSNLDINMFLTKSGGKITGPIIREGDNVAWITTKNGGGSPGLVQENYKGWNPFVRIKSHAGWFSIGTYYTPSPSDVNDFNIVGFKDSNNVNSPDTKFSLSLDGRGFINNREIFTRGNFDPNSKANVSHGTHVPAPEGANNAKFLRCDNTWQIVSPGNIGAYTKDEVNRLLDGRVPTLYLQSLATNNINGAQGSGVNFRYILPSAAGKPTGTDHGCMTMAWGDSWYYQIAGDWRTNDLYIRGSNGNASSPKGWSKVFHTGNFIPDARSSVNKTINITKGVWSDTGIRLEGGTYIVNIFVNDYNNQGAQYSETYVGTFSFYPHQTNSNVISEIPLTSSGHATNNRFICLGFKRVPHEQGLTAQLVVTANGNVVGATYDFRFRRLM